METKKLLSSLIVPIVAYLSLAAISFLATSMQSGFSGSQSAQAVVLGAVWTFLRPLSYLLAAWATIRYGLEATRKFSLGKGEIALGAILLGIIATLLFVLGPQPAMPIESVAVWGAGLSAAAIFLSIAGSIWGSGEKAQGDALLEPEKAS